MARIRSIKPEFFRHRRLFLAEKETGLPLRVAFAGLWTCADREGRFRWEPEELKLDCLPYDDVDFGRVLDALCTRGFIVKYASQGREYGHIPSWAEHQIVNNRESSSKLPAPEESEIIPITSTREPRVDDASSTRHGLAQGEGKGREGNGRESQPAADAARLSVVRDEPENETLEAKVFRIGKRVLGKNAGGLITRLRRIDGMTDVRACDLLMQAEGKDDPREWIGAIIRNGDEDGERLRRDREIYRGVMI